MTKIFLDTEHNALWDARVIRACYEKLTSAPLAQGAS